MVPLFCAVVKIYIYVCMYCNDLIKSPGGLSVGSDFMGGSLFEGGSLLVRNNFLRWGLIQGGLIQRRGHN